MPTCPPARNAQNRGSYRLVAATAAAASGAGRVAVTLDWQLRNAADRIVGRGTARSDGTDTAWEHGKDGLPAALAHDAAPAIARLVAGDAPPPAANVAATLKVARVSGAPGDGSASLARAIAAALGRAGVDVASGGGRARFTLSCQVETAPVPNGQAARRGALGARRGERRHDRPGRAAEHHSSRHARRRLGRYRLCRRRCRRAGHRPADRTREDRGCRRLKRAAKAVYSPGTVCYSPAAARCPRRRSHENPRVQQQSAAGRGDFGLSRHAAHRCERAALFRHGSFRRGARERARRGRVRDPVDVLSRRTTI